MTVPLTDPGHQCSIGLTPTQALNAYRRSLTNWDRDPHTGIETAAVMRSGTTVRSLLLECSQGHYSEIFLD